MFQTQPLSKFATQSLERQIVSAKSQKRSTPSPAFQKQPSNETDNDSDRRKSSGNLLYEIAMTNNPKKMERLAKLFMSQENQVKQIQESLTRLEILNMFFKVQQLRLPEIINFQQVLFESLDEESEVLRCLLLCNYEQYYGSKGQVFRVLECLAEIQTMNPDFKSFEEEYEIGVSEVSIALDRVQFRVLFILSTFEVIRVLRALTVLVEQLENQVFQLIKSNITPNDHDLENLIISYVLLSEQLDVAQKMGLSRQALEIMHKDNLIDIRKKFISNAHRFAQKYLGGGIQEKVHQIYKRMQPDAYFRSSLSGLQSPAYLFLTEILDMNFMLTAIENFEVERRFYSLVKTQTGLIDRLVPDNSKKKTRTNTDEPGSKPSVSSQRQFTIKTATSIPKIPERSQTEKNSTIQEKKSAQDYEQIQSKLLTQQKELDELRSFYNQQQAQKKIDQTQQADQFKKKIDVLEASLSTLKQENLTQKKEKEQKMNEVVELKNQLINLQEKQQKLEKLVQIQVSQQPAQQLQQPSIRPTNNSQQSGTSSKVNTQTTMHMNIQIPNTKRPFQRGQSQNTQSPIEDFNQMDDTSPHLFRSNQFQAHQLLELLDTQSTFSREYKKYSGTDWDSQATEEQLFRVEASVIEQEGKVVLLKAFKDTQQLCVEQLPVDIVKSLLQYVDMQEMLPTNLPNISNTHQFFKYLILPYSAVVFDEMTQQYRVQLWPKPYSMLNGLTLKQDFLDNSCLIYVNHLEYDSFRITVCDPISYESIRMDLEMDYSTMDKFFKDAKNIKDEYVFYTKSNMFKMTEKAEQIGEDDVAQGLVERFFDPVKIKEVRAELNMKQTFSMERLTLKTPSEFLKYIRGIVIDFEAKLRSLNMSFNSSILGQKYFRCKSWNIGTRNQIQIVRDNTANQQIEIYLQNTFETFAPEKTKIKAKGQISLSYFTVQKDFAVIYEKLSPEERSPIYQSILTSFNLGIFEKLCEQSHEQFDKNPIIQSNWECGSYRRLITYDQGKIVQVTYQVLGSNRKMCGIKFAVFIPEDTVEYGIFMPATANEWDLRVIDKMKIKSSVENVPFSELLLTQVLKSPSVMQILFRKILSVDPKTNQINTMELKKRRSYIERVDNIISMQEILALQF